MLGNEAGSVMKDNFIVFRLFQRQIIQMKTHSKFGSSADVRR